MGADLVQETITAMSKEEAIAAYGANPPLGYYDNQCYFIRDVHYFDNIFLKSQDAFDFLLQHVKKWDNFAVMCKCGSNLYAYIVILPC